MNSPIKTEIVKSIAPLTVTRQTRLCELEHKLEENLAKAVIAFCEVGRALKEIRDQDLYREQGYTSFDKYCQDRWKFKKSRASHLIKSASVFFEVLLPISDEVPIPDNLNERQIRPLTRLNDPNLQQEVWRQAHKDNLITGENIEKLVKEILVESNCLPKSSSKLLMESDNDTQHTQIQWVLTKLGRRLCDFVWIARNDHSKFWQNESFSKLSIENLPILNIDNYSQKETIPYIDVVWLKGKNQIVAAFEIECTTSIYSGLLRLLDLIELCPNQTFPIYIVIPETRIKQFERELSRPSFKKLSSSNRCFGITIESINKNWDHMMAWSDAPSVINKLAFSLTRE